MLTREEMHMLAWIAQFSPLNGAIIDLGAFLGGSTISLSYGLAQAKKIDKVYSYDKWIIDEINKFRFLYKKGHGFYAGSDAFPVFKKFTNIYEDYIISYKGNILDQNWHNQSISILFIDLSKTLDINDHIIKVFFEYLVPGSIIIQQNFLFFRNPWLYPTMYKLNKYVELLSYTEDNSVIFGVNEKIPTDILDNCLSYKLSKNDYIEAISFYKSKFPFLRQIEMIDALLEVFEKKPDARNAWDFPQPIKVQYKFEDTD